SDVARAQEVLGEVGETFFDETLGRFTFRVSMASFFQTNTRSAERLYQVTREALELTGRERLLDAYCGIGTLTLPLAKRVWQAIGLEVQSESVEQAKLNATLNGIENVSFQTGAVEDLLPRMAIAADHNSEESVPDIVLLDPPRKGCDPAVINALLHSTPNRIVYVSCNPSTLARDLKLLCQARYRLTRVQPADFFPQTPHVECAAFLSAC
ncbi:MAG: 23S rRNA (uracil(1939)-C(5))-methyltransferase RlmD, partial [Leptolyngbyaceae cyanobacterium RM2_2_4]|nr:23S rRNA (uracil(1939)-C(5))-methyltransferase RlmD [Leptolyngbyaceae cyanobacterium RM2_2_4]